MRHAANAQPQRIVTDETAPLRVSEQRPTHAGYVTNMTVGRGLAPAAVFRFAKNRSPTAWAITPPPTLRATPLINEGGKFAALRGT